MLGNLSFDQLKQQVSGGVIDTVLVCLVDMQGRLMGKRFHAQNFIEFSSQETHCCNYLLATDMEMATPNGYASSSWSQGYGDFVMRPDLQTLRTVPWLEGTVMVLCDILDHHHQLVSHSPRQVLKRQVERLASLGYTAKTATELEFFIFEKSFDEIRKEGFRKLEPISGYNQDYHIFQTTKEECVMRPIRNHLYAAGVPVENSKGEAEKGQEELNIRYAEALLCADHHTIAKQATKEIAWQQGRAVSFMSKWDHNMVGSAAHVHQSLWEGDESAFFDKNDPLGMSNLMRQYLAGLIKYAPDYTLFLAPYVNSYKRFTEGTFAPTKAVWSSDNRTAAFRLCGESTTSVRIECRVGGADINPYLAIAGQLAAGIKGIEDQLECPEAVCGDIYEMEDAPNLPRNLRQAIETFRGSAMLKEAMGEDVVAHYTRAGEIEQEEFDKIVTDWEVARGFERS